MFRWLFNIGARFHPYRTQWVEDLPGAPQKDTVYVIGGRRNPFSAAVVCPRKKCRQIIQLDISPQVKPRWKMREHSDGRISLWPSVLVTNLPCRCHYWMRRGHIVWSESPTVRVPEANRHD